MIKLDVGNIKYKKVISLLLIMMISIVTLSALTLIDENIQNWTAQTAYGNYTQAIPAGTVTLTSCIVTPNAMATGTCSMGKIQVQATNGCAQFPELPSIGQVEFHLVAGSTGRSIKLQKLNGANWDDITTFTGITSAGSTYSYNVNIQTPTTIRLARASHVLYVHDIIITDYQSSVMPMVTTSTVTSIIYNAATGGGDIGYSGTSAIITKGVCWNSSPFPNLTNNFTSDGTGIGVFTSNITGLQPETDYYVRAYATNSSGTSYGEDVVFHSGNIVVPTIQSTNLVFYPGSYSIQATWIPGNGAKRIVKINTVNNFTLPVNGTDYPANTAYSGSGEQVIYNGATQVVESQEINAVTATNLTPATNYWFRIFECNGDNAASLYNTVAAQGNPANSTTLNAVVTGYYDDITGTGAALKSNLSNLIRTTHLTHFSYDALWTQIQYTDEDSTNTNNIIEQYTGWSVPKSYYGVGTNVWTREHTWSKSHGDFGDVAPAGTDLHHLRPADAFVNGSKGNKDFDDGGTPVISDAPYGTYSGVTGCYTDADSYEPRSVEKGDIARMLLYMAVRYEGTDTSYNLEMADTTPASTNSSPYYGKLSTLLQWHVQDPPDSWELRRNNRIQERQGNRNPFIDHPEFVNMIWAPTTTNATNINPAGFTANWTSAVNAGSYVLDVATDSLFTHYVTGYQNLNVNNVTSYVVGNLPAQQKYYYRLRSFFTVGYSMSSNVTSVSSFTGIHDNYLPSIQATINHIYPNPFHGIATFELNLAKTENITVSVYNIKGQCVTTLFSGTKTSGQQTLTWNSKDSSGNICSPGIYFLRLESSKNISNKKLILY